MAEQLWTDERIAQESLPVAKRWDGQKVERGSIYALGRQIVLVAQQVRDDLQAALDAANQRIHELEIEREAMLLSLTLREQALRQLEAQAAWEPLPDGLYDTQHEGNKVKVSGEWLTVREKNIFNPGDADIADAALPDNIRLCRRKEAQP